MSLVEKDNAFKQFTVKLSTTPSIPSYRPPVRNPILQEEVNVPVPKTYTFKPINPSPEKKTGIKMGAYAEQFKKSNVFGEPLNEFVPSKKYIAETLTDRSPPISLKKSICQPPQRDPIIQDTITPELPKVREKIFTSSVFDHLFKDPNTLVESKERQGKYFEYMNSQIFQSNGREPDPSPKKKLLGNRAEVEDLLQYKDANKYRDTFTVKDPVHNKIKSNDLVQKKALSGCAKVYRIRRNQSAITF